MTQPRQQHLQWAAIGTLLGLLAACSSTPPRPPVLPGDPGRSSPNRPADADGPPDNPPVDVLQIPDAEPKVEPIKPGGPNKPYEVQGERYTPMVEDRPVIQTGLASWYGRKFHGKPTASGEIYSLYGMTAAHRTLPIPSYARVRNPRNGKEVIVRVNDRGPFHRERVIDLSYAAAAKLDLLRGLGTVEIERLTHDAIRTGSWRRLALPEVTVVQETEPAPQPKAVSAAADMVATPLEAGPVQRDPVRTTAGRGWWVQLGAFSQQDKAIELQRNAGTGHEWLAPLLALFQENGLHKLQAGPYERRSDATAAMQRIHDLLGLKPILVSRH